MNTYNNNKYIIKFKYVVDYDWFNLIVISHNI